MDQVVIYGNGQVAGLAYFYLTHDSKYEVVAFAVEGSFIKEPTFNGLPLISLEEARRVYPPETHKMFVAMGYGRINKEREERYGQVKALGYELISYVSSKATVWPGVVIGENCFIMEGNVIQPFATIGNDVVMWSACHVGHETIIKDHCFLSAHSVVSRQRRHRAELLPRGQLHHPERGHPGPCLRDRCGGRDHQGHQGARRLRGTESRAAGPDERPAPGPVADRPWSAPLRSASTPS